MKKEVTYYLEDLSRLSEISQSELDSWINEMPFHQPLQMLAGIKSEMEGRVPDKEDKVRAAYFAEDYEVLPKTKSKKGKQIKDKKNNLTLLEDSSSKKATEAKEVNFDEEGTSLPLDLIVNIDVEKGSNKETEEAEEPVILRIVSSALADETLEDELIHEVLEDDLHTDITQTTTPNEYISPSTEESDASETDVPGLKSLELEVEEDNMESQDIDIEPVAIKLDNAKEIEKKTKAKGNKKPKAKKQKNNKLKKIEKKKVKSDKKKEKSIKISAAKKGKKGQKKKSNKKVEYVFVDSTSERNFKLEDYDGVSNYTSWLLKQESINGKNEKSAPIAKAVKKSKPKKNKKKSKKLKIAVDSVKEQDTIISEPLARILALQGHSKKAKKMYLKLIKVFPEKKMYFEEKIAALKS